MKNKTVVIYHRADFDGLFCREIARKFLGETNVVFIGWDHGDALLPFPEEGTVYVMDLSPDCLVDVPGIYRIERLIWIDHHKSSIEKWSPAIPGYRIDGVSACRLAWQWFAKHEQAIHPTCGADDVSLPVKQEYVDRKVEEPYAVRLAGEYDIWDKRDPNAETFQFGLRSQELTPQTWRILLQTTDLTGLAFLAINVAYCNSATFAATLQPEHDGLMGFYWTGTEWRVSLYHAKGKEQHDLSAIAVRYGGGGHRGACGFRTKVLPFVQPGAVSKVRDEMRGKVAELERQKVELQDRLNALVRWRGSRRKMNCGN